jgi:hypothetical protein
MKDLAEGGWPDLTLRDKVVDPKPKALPELRRDNRIKTNRYDSIERIKLHHSW